MWKFHQYLYDQQNITCPLGVTNFIFSCWKYLSLVRCAHSWAWVKLVFGVKFVSPCGHVISSINFILVILEIYWNSIRKNAAKFSLRSGTLRLLRRMHEKWNEVKKFSQVFTSVFAEQPTRPARSLPLVMITKHHGYCKIWTYNFFPVALC